MTGHVCYHCKQWVAEDEPHDCWTTTEAALTRELPEDLQDAWERLRDTAAAFGPQRIYASHKSIMFSRKACYFFVRPKRNFLEAVVFLGRALKAPQVKRVTPSSRTKFAHLIQFRHRDEVEAPITDWLREAYEQSDALGARGAVTSSNTRKAKPKARSKKTATTRKATKRAKRARKTTGRR
jgi:Domain of unknown function (DUF5655)